MNLLSCVKKPDTGQVLGIVYRIISMGLVMKAGYSKKVSTHWRGSIDSQMTAQGTLRPLN